MEEPRQKTTTLRPPHMLNPTVSNTRPRRIIFFDTETNQTDLEDGKTLHTIKLGVARYCYYTRDGQFKRGEELVFRSEGEFWQWVDMNKLSEHKTYVVAHNLVFDLSVLDGFKELAILGWELTSFYSKSYISIFRWRKGKHRLIGLDNGNFFAGKLEKWGEVFDLPKMEVDFETVNDEDLLNYCRRDVDIMIECWRSWLTFLDEHDCGAFKPTVASTAFNAWRYKSDDALIHVHSDEEVLALERDAYRGGRVECLWVGHREDGQFYYLDVNGMYAFIMQKYSYPAGLYGYSENLDLYHLAYKLERYDVIARVIIQPTVPYFPIVYDRHTCYPLGRFETVLTTPELKLCIREGWLKEVKEMSWYRTARLFRDHVNFFHALRLRYEREGLEGYARISKLLNNALYGKLGQRGFKQEIIGECEPHILRREEGYNIDLDYYYTQLFIGGKIYREWKEGESYHSLPAIPAHVTAYARLYLYNLVNMIEYKHVYYMDTDSLIVDQIGYDRLRQYVKPDVLGYLKVERSSPWLTVNAPKDYQMEGRAKIKGISKDAVRVGVNTYSQTHWLKLPGLMQEGIDHGYMTKTVEKTLKRIIYSGLVSQSGWITPFVLPQFQPVAHPFPHLVEQDI